MADLDVLIVGPYPPPFGGISAHVERVAKMMLAQGLSVRIANHFGGGENDSLVFDVLIAVSVEVERSLRSIGPPVEVVPAYLPVRDRARLSTGADAFLRNGTNLLMAVYRMSVDARGRTVYGLETAIVSFAALASSRSDLRLAIFLASAPGSRRESERLRRLIDRVRDDDIRRRIGVFCGEPLTAALPLAAVYLRPTLTDGDAVSIREAIAAGVPVVASDVVRRPPGVITVGPEAPAWRDAILQALGRERPSVDPERYAPATYDAAGDDPADALISIYGRLGCAPVGVGRAANA